MKAGIEPSFSFYREDRSKNQNSGSPIEFFKLFITPEIAETNWYSQQFLEQNLNLKERNSSYLEGDK